jgi:hypothetical protein
MNSITIKSAIKLRKLIKSLPREESCVLTNILGGEYDQCKEEAETVAIRDFEFLTKDRDESEQNEEA